MENSVSLKFMGEAAKCLERMFCGVPIKEIPGKRGYVHWPPRYTVFLFKVVKTGD